VLSAGVRTVRGTRRMVRDLAAAGATSPCTRAGRSTFEAQTVRACAESLLLHEKPQSCLPGGTRQGGEIQGLSWGRQAT
jgi:hypothetical protein